eukprot:c21150_g1_i3.p1 GENE.c21150_g1_i3~~c21150_g1_i3.p1  ORF type:complete len:752 (+),score=305.72 c21150_g1_i3:10-2265(+)
MFGRRDALFVVIGGVLGVVVCNLIFITLSSSFITLNNQRIDSLQSKLDSEKASYLNLESTHKSRVEHYEQMLSLAMKETEELRDKLENCPKRFLETIKEKNNTTETASPSPTLTPSHTSTPTYTPTPTFLGIRPKPQSIQSYEQQICNRMKIDLSLLHKAFTSIAWGESLYVMKSGTNPSFFISLQNPSKDTIISARIAFDGFWDPSIALLFQHLLYDVCETENPMNIKSLPLVVDAGANIGFFGLYAAALGCRVIAIEPQERLGHNINLSKALNLYGERYTLVQTLISDHQGAVNFTVKEDNWGGSCINKGEEINENMGERIERKRTTTIDSLISEKVKLMKIDVEGFEFELVKGGENLFEKHGVENILMEFDPHRIGLDRSVAMLKYFKSLNYSLRVIPFIEIAQKDQFPSFSARVIDWEKYATDVYNVDCSLMHRCYDDIWLELMTVNRTQVNDTDIPYSEYPGTAVSEFEALKRKKLAETLPAGWVSQLHPETNKLFYYNTLTKISQWEKPDSNASKLINNIQNENNKQEDKNNIISSNDNDSNINNNNNIQVNNNVISNDETLPPGWIAVFDPNSKKIYYHNPISGKSQWEKPKKKKKGKLNNKIEKENFDESFNENFNGNSDENLKENSIEITKINEEKNVKKEVEKNEKQQNENKKSSQNMNGDDVIIIEDKKNEIKKENQLKPKIVAKNDKIDQIKIMNEEKISGDFVQESNSSEEEEEDNFDDKEEKMNPDEFDQLMNREEV